MGPAFLVPGAPGQEVRGPRSPRLLASYFLWVKTFATTKEPEIKRNCMPILRFLQSEIGRRLTPEQLKLRLQDILGEQEEIERAALYEEPELGELILSEPADAAS